MLPGVRCVPYYQYVLRAPTLAPTKTPQEDLDHLIIVTAGGSAVMIPPVLIPVIMRSFSVHRGGSVFVYYAVVLLVIAASSK